MTEENPDQPDIDSFRTIVHASAEGRAKATKAAGAINDGTGSKQVNCKYLKDGLAAMDATAGMIDDHVRKHGAPSVNTPEQLKTDLGSGSAGRVNPEALAKAKNRCGLVRK